MLLHLNCFFQGIAVFENFDCPEYATLLVYKIEEAHIDIDGE